MVFGGIFPLIYLHIRLSPSQAPSFHPFFLHSSRLYEDKPTKHTGYSGFVCERIKKDRP